jgi:hypothetical protein
MAQAQAQLADVVKQLQSQQKSADKNADENVKTLDEVKGSILQLIELQKPSFKDKEASLESSRRKAKVSNTFSGSGFGSGLAKGLGITGIMGMLGSVLSGAMAGIGTVLYGVGLAAGTAILAGGALYLAPIIGEWVAKLLENTFKDLDIPFLGNDKETKDSVTRAIGDSVKWGIYGIMIAKLLGKRFGIIFAASGWVYETINDWLTKSASNEGTWANSLAKGWDEYFDTNNGQEMMAKIGSSIAAAIAAFAVYKTPAMLRAINPFSGKPNPNAPPSEPMNLRTTRPPAAGPIGPGMPAGGLKPSMFNPADLLGKDGKPLKPQQQLLRMDKLAREGKFLAEATETIMKTPWWKTLGAAASKIAIPLQAAFTGYDVLTNPEFAEANKTGHFGLSTGASVAAIIPDIMDMTSHAVNLGLNKAFDTSFETDYSLGTDVRKFVVDTFLPDLLKGDAVKAELDASMDAYVLKFKQENGLMPSTPQALNAPPPPASYYGGQSGGAKPSQFFNSVNNQQFESFYFGGGTTMDVNDASGLALSWR